MKWLYYFQKLCFQSLKKRWNQIILTSYLGAARLFIADQFLITMRETSQLYAIVTNWWWKSYIALALISAIDWNPAVPVQLTASRTKQNYTKYLRQENRTDLSGHAAYSGRAFYKIYPFQLIFYNSNEQNYSRPIWSDGRKALMFGCLTLCIFFIVFFWTLLVHKVLNIAERLWFLLSLWSTIEFQSWIINDSLLDLQTLLGSKKFHERPNPFSRTM